MADAGELRYKTDLDTNGFESGLKKLGSIGKQGLSVVAGAITATTTAIAGGIAVGAKYNATIEQYATSFEVMTGSAEKATEVVEKLKKLGAETPFEMTDLADTTQLLMNYGLTADDAIDKMMMLGDISQGSADKMNRIAMAYGQMSSAGKVSLEDVKQMIEAGFNPLQEISQTTGESMASLYDRISKGKISVDEITASMQRSTEAGGKYFQSMEKQSQTVNGQISTLKDNFSQLLGKAAEPLNDVLANKILPKINEIIEKISYEDIEKFFNAIITGLNVLIPLFLAIKSYGIIVSLAKGIKLMFTVASAIKGVTIAQTLLNVVMMANPIGLVIAGIVALVSAFTILWMRSEGFRNFWIGLWDSIKNIFSKVVEFIKNRIQLEINFYTKILPEFINRIINWFKKLPQNISIIINNIVQLFSQLPSRIWQWLVNTINRAIQWRIRMASIALQAGRDFVNSIWNTIKELPGRMVSVGRNIVTGIWNGIVGAKNWLNSKIRGFADNIVNGFKSKLGIHSPSRVMAYWSKFIPQGIAVGIEADTDKAIKAIDQMNDKIDNKMKNAVYTEMGKINTNATIKSNNLFRNVTNLDLKVDGTVDIDGRKAGILLAKPIIRTIKQGGVYA